jgi:hypothetical protein
MRHIHQHALVLAITLLLAASAALAQTSHTERTEKPPIDLFNLEECIPMRIEDGYISSQPTWGGPADIPRDFIDAQMCIQWGHGDCTDWVQAKVKASWSMYENWQGTIGTIVKNNSFDETGDGDVFIEARKQFHNDANHSAALWGIGANFPVGQDYARIDTSFPGYSFVINERDNDIDISVFGVYSRILDAEKRERLHGEIMHTFVRSAPLDFNSTRWFLAAGYDRQINEKTLGMASIWWEENPNRLSADSSALQLGVRRKESQRFVWGASFNLGLSWEDADWSMTLAGQRRF